MAWGRRQVGVVTSEAATSPGGGDSCVEEGPRGSSAATPHTGSRGPPVGTEAICVSSALDGDARGVGGKGGGRQGQVRRRREATSGCRGIQTPTSAGNPREGATATCGSYREFASAENDACGGGSGSWVATWLHQTYQTCPTYLEPISLPLVYPRQSTYYQIWNKIYTPYYSTLPHAPTVQTRSRPHTPPPKPSVAAAPDPIPACGCVPCGPEPAPHARGEQEARNSGMH